MIQFPIILAIISHFYRSYWHILNRLIQSTSMAIDLNCPIQITILIRKPINHSFLDACCLFILLLSARTHPIHVIRDVGAALHFIFHISKRWLLVWPECALEVNLRILVVLIVLRPQSAIVHEHIAVASRSITLIVERFRILFRTWWLLDFDTGIVTIKLHTGVTHAILKLTCQSTIVNRYLQVPARAITIVTGILRVERPLESCQILIRLSLIRKIHSFDYKWPDTIWRWFM